MLSPAETMKELVSLDALIKDAALPCHSGGQLPGRPAVSG